MRNPVMAIRDFFASNPDSGPMLANQEKKYVEKELAAGSFLDNMFGDEAFDNPNDLIDKKGLSVIDDLLGDDAIGAFTRMKKEARLATPFDIEPASTSNEDEEIAAFIRWALFEYCETPFRDFLEHLFSGVEYGFSLSEKVLTVVDEGEYKSKLAYARMTPQNPHAYKFKMDNGRRVAENGIINISGYGEGISLPRAKFILYSYKPKWGNPYGSSDVARAYPFWIIKKYFRRFWAIHGERIAGGFIVATFDENVSEKHRDNLKLVLEGVSAKTWMMIPTGVSIDIKESTGQGGVFFQNSINAMNIYMARTVLVPDLLGFSAKPTGSYALGKKHFDVFLWVLESMGNDAQHIVKEQVIRPLVTLNYGAGVSLPRFVFDPLTMGDKIEILSSFYTAVEKGIFNPADIPDQIREWILKTLTAPHSEIPEGKKPTVPGFTPDKKEEPEPEPAPLLEAASTRGFNRKLLPTERKVDFASIQTVLDSLESTAIEQWRDVAIQQRDNLVKLAGKFIETHDKKIEKIRLVKAGQINELVKNMLVTAYLNARWEAAREVRDTLADKMEMDSFADILPEPVPPKQALAHFVGKGLKVKPSDLVPYTRKAFLVTGIEREKILAQAKMIIMKGVRDNNTIRAKAELKKLFDPYIETGEIRDGALSKAYRIETIIRTNLNEAYNEGRHDAFTDRDVEDYIEAYQISAVLDGVTTDICASLDGRILDKEELDSYGWPPYHYNCRTLVSPIVRGESFEVNGLPAGIKKPFSKGV